MSGDRHRELGGVDDALLEGREDVRTGEELGGHAHLLHDLRTEAEEPHLEALEELLGVVDFLPEPAGGLRTDAEAVDRRRATRVVELLAQLVAAAEELPGLELADLRAERDRGEERDRAAEHVGVVAGGGPTRVDRALRGRLELLRARHQRARLVELDLEVSAGHLLDALGERDAGGSEDGNGGPEGAGHLPADAVLRACVERGHRSHGPGKARDGDESCLLLEHVRVPPFEALSIDTGTFKPSGRNMRRGSRQTGRSASS